LEAGELPEIVYTSDATTCGSYPLPTTLARDERVGFNEATAGDARLAQDLRGQTWKIRNW